MYHEILTQNLTKKQLILTVSLTGHHLLFLTGQEEIINEILDKKRIVYVAG